MKFKTDENLPLEAALLLRNAEFACETVQDEGLIGAPDTSIAASIKAEGRILITLDLDFANIRAYPPGDYVGIIVLRSRGQDKASVLALIKKLIIVLGERIPKSELWVVQRDRIRFRQAN